MHKPIVVLGAAVILVAAAAASGVDAQTSDPVISGAGDVSNSLQRTISGTYVPQKFDGAYSFIRLVDGPWPPDGAFYNLGDAYPDTTTGHWSITVTLGV